MRDWQRLLAPRVLLALRYDFWTRIRGLTMTLADLTSIGLIIPHLCGDSSASVIQELGQTLHREGIVPDLLPFYQAALNREFLAGTDIDAGIAIPHARLPGLKDVAFAFGRSDKPLAWSGRTSWPITLVFLIAAPATDSTRYLALISGLARLSTNSQLLNRLHAAKGPSEILNIFQQVQVRSNTTSDAKR